MAPARSCGGRSLLRFVLSAALCLVTVALVAATSLAMWRTNLWWVRMTDFPRLQYLVLLAALLVLLALVRAVPARLRIGLGVLALVAAGYNGWKLAPYGPGGMARNDTCAPDRRMSVMVANVKLENHHAGALLQIVRDRDPDMLLALETTEWWDRQLAALSEEMPFAVAKITGSYFGIHLLSRLPLSEAEVAVPVGQDTPAILATATLPSGDRARFLGVHPRPPHPGQSSIGRDAVLMWAALRARAADAPVILAGDLNAVPWERTIERMQRIGGLIDPRDIHGFLPTYDAHSSWMAWPLDQILHQDGLSVLSMEVLDGFGSDHYPVEVVLCHADAMSAPPPLEAGDLDRADAIIAAARPAAPD